MAVEEITNGNESEARDSVAPCTIPSSKMELLEERNLYIGTNGEETTVENEIGGYVAPCTIPCGKIENKDSYNDKNVMQCEPPEMIACYKENEYHVVKDICIDEGVPLKDKIVIDRENDKDLRTTILHSDENQIGDMTNEREESEVLSPNGSKSSSENGDIEDDDAHEWGAKDEVDMESLLADALTSLLDNHLVDDINNGGYLAPMRTGEANFSTIDKTVDDVPQAKSLKSLLKSPNSNGNEIQGQSGQLPSSESEHETPTVVSITDESNKSSPDNRLSYNSKVESATITFDFNSSKSAAISRDENPGDVDHEQPLKIDTKPMQEGGISDTPAVGSEIRQGQGESSFSMAGFSVSGQITYSGPMTFSRSVSLRSDSSTTSTRSFAFPIIQSEWNSSPIRMAKADRRHYRKHRGWSGLLCCRF